MDATGQGQTFKVVRIFDPAIRWSEGAKDGHTDVREYAKTRVFDSLIAVEGQRPMVFHTTRLRRSVTRDIECMSAEPHKRERAFAIGVSLVEIDGAPVKPAGDTWTEKELDIFDFVDIEDVGNVVLERSRLPKDSPASYGGSHSSAVASVVLLSRIAAQNQSDAGSGSKPPAVAPGT
jgi:hypothetical protein